MDAPDAKRRKCRADDAMEPVFFYTELLTAFDIVGVIDFAWERARRAAVRLGVLFWALLSKATKLGKTHVAELHCCCSSHWSRTSLQRRGGSATRTSGVGTVPRRSSQRTSW